MKRKYSFFFILSILVFSLFACESLGLPEERSRDSHSIDLSTIITMEKIPSSEEHAEEDANEVIEDEDYYEKDQVALYIHLYSQLPPNYITKEEADDMGWSVEDNGGYVIGGNRFGNREGLLPEKKGRQYYEADLVEGYTDHRGPVRLVYSNDGLIFYTDDHYSSFTQLY